MLEYAGQRLVIDPAFDDAGASPPVGNTPNQKRNPLVPMPDGWRDAIAGVDAAVITHLHRDYSGVAALRNPSRPIHLKWSS